MDFCFIELNKFDITINNLQSIANKRIYFIEMAKDEMIKEQVLKSRVEGREEGMVKKLLAQGIDLQIVSQVNRLSPKQIQNI